MRPETFAAAFAALYAAHTVADIWIQTHRQALAKAAPGLAGRLACLGHVVTLTITAAAALAAVIAVTGLRPSLVAVAVALAVNGVTHYWADRRWTLQRLAGRLGKGEFYRLGAPRSGHDDNITLGTGAFQLDQAWHIGWLFIAALIIAL
jgi:hypothetical protein